MFQNRGETSPNRLERGEGSGVATGFLHRCWYPWIDSAIWLSPENNLSPSSFLFVCEGMIRRITRNGIVAYRSVSGRIELEEQKLRLRSRPLSLTPLRAIRLGQFPFHRWSWLHQCLRLGLDGPSVVEGRGFATTCR